MSVNLFIFSFCNKHQQIINIKRNQFWKRWESRLNELCSDVKACPGAVKLVQGLADLGIPMAIATSSRHRAVEKKRVK